VRAVPTLEHAAPRARLGALPPLAPLAAGALVAALDLLFPALCPVCRTPLGPGRRDPLCGPCWGGIARIEPPWCEACGLPLSAPRPVPVVAAPAPPAGGGAGDGGAPERVSFRAEGGPPSPSASVLCGACEARPPAYDWGRAAARYEGPLREALHALKFGGRRALARPLADLLVEQCGAALPADAVVVPVPLGRDRERARGFNQAALIAGRAAKRLGLGLERRWLARVRATSPQSELAAAERSANVRGAFRASPEVRGRHVLLVDDVMTTGATLAECARAVAAAGAARVGVLAVARVL